MKLLHFADLHLDAQFAWMGGSAHAARRRREALRETLMRILHLAQEERVDAVLCGGDLYEHDRCAPDTGPFLRQAFADIHPIPVFLAPGNHDWLGPASLYRLVAWTPNVHLFTESRLAPYRLDDGITLWGSAHQAPANTPDFLAEFRVDRSGVNLALFHGSEQASFAWEAAGKQPHAPFHAAEIARSGLDHAFLGHFHRGRMAGSHTYPGNPDPLDFGEEGERGIVLATIQPDGKVLREARRVAVTPSHEVEVDITGCDSLTSIRRLIAEHLRGLRGVARVTLRGELDRAIDLRADDITGMDTDLDGLVIRTGNLTNGYDFDLLAGQPTVQGQFVRDVLGAPDLDDAERRRILITGLRALDGRRDLQVE
ncbi:MAG TPA: metallophosphoesterase [Chloroflexota bacterium]|nr:metallophosphoesterase [Chloroflexota bacterium]